MKGFVSLCVLALFLIIGFSCASPTGANNSNSTGPSPTPATISLSISGQSYNVGTYYPTTPEFTSVSSASGTGASFQIPTVYYYDYNHNSLPANTPIPINLTITNNGTSDLTITNSGLYPIAINGSITSSGTLGTITIGGGSTSMNVTYSASGSDSNTTGTNPINDVFTDPISAAVIPKNGGTVTVTAYIQAKPHGGYVHFDGYYWKEFKFSVTEAYGGSADFLFNIYGIINC